MKNPRGLGFKAPFTGPISSLPRCPAMTVQEGLQAMKLQDLKNKKPADLLSFAEELEIENASSMRKQDMLFAILKELAERNVEIMGQGVVETLQDGFGFLRSPESNYLREAGLARATAWTPAAALAVAAGRAR